MGKLEDDADVGLVSLVELGARCGGMVEFARAYLNGAPILENWAGEPAVRARDARLAVQRYEAARREAEQVQKDWEAYLQAWTARRDRAYADAYHQAAAREVERMKAAAAEQGMILQTQEGFLPPDAQNRVFAAAREALRNWEERHPKPTDPADFAQNRARYERSLEKD